MALLILCQQAPSGRNCIENMKHWDRSLTWCTYLSQSQLSWFLVTELKQNGVAYIFESIQAFLCMHVLRLARSLSDQKGPRPKGQQSEPLNLVLKSMVNWFQQVALCVMLIKIAPKYILKAVEISCNSFNKSSLRQLGGQKANQVLDTWNTFVKIVSNYGQWTRIFLVQQLLDDLSQEKPHH